MIDWTTRGEAASRTLSRIAWIDLAASVAILLCLRGWRSVLGDAVFADHPLSALTGTLAVILLLFGLAALIFSRLLWRVSRSGILDGWRVPAREEARSVGNRYLWEGASLFFEVSVLVAIALAVVLKRTGDAASPAVAVLWGTLWLLFALGALCAVVAFLLILIGIASRTAARRPSPS